MLIVKVNMTFIYTSRKIHRHGYKYVKHIARNSIKYSTVSSSWKRYVSLKKLLIVDGNKFQVATSNKYFEEHKTKNESRIKPSSAWSWNWNPS